MPAQTGGCRKVRYVHCFAGLPLVVRLVVRLIEGDRFNFKMLNKAAVIARQ